MTDLAATFQHEAVAEAYQHRPPYPEEVFDRLEALIADEPRRVLDIGAGEGAIARPLAPRVERVDAIDISQAMVDAGRQRPGGDQAEHPLAGEQHRDGRAGRAVRARHRRREHPLDAVGGDVRPDRPAPDPRTRSSS